MVMICTTCPNWSVTGQCFLATLHIESVAHSGTVNIRTNGDELQHWIRSLPARICHRGRSIVQCLTDIIINFFSVSGIGSELDVAQASVENTLFSSSGQAPAAGLGSRYVSRGHRDLKGLEMISDLTLYDFSSLCVCIYKYICVFIFNIEHTHMISTPTAHVLNMGRVLWLKDTCQLWFAVHWRQRCTIHFSLHEFNQ